MEPSGGNLIAVTAGRTPHPTPVAERTEVVVTFSNDRLLVLGLSTFLQGQGLECISYRLEEAIQSLPIGEDPAVVLVDLRFDIGSDRIAGCDVVRSVATHHPFVNVIALGLGDLPPLVRLRLAEAGAHFLFSLDELGFHPEWVVEVMKGQNPVNRLPTRWELRQQLGLAWDGSLEMLVGMVRELPARVWDDAPKLRSVPRTRRQIQALRRAASIAGFPPPDHTKYSTAYRSAPADPEWPEVWKIAKEVLGRDGRDARQNP